MRRLATVILCCFLYFVQAQLLPLLFSTDWLPDAILTTVIAVTLFKGRTAGLVGAAIGGAVQDILISNFFGLHVFPYMIIVYLLSIVNNRLYEERWYWTSCIVAVCTVLDGVIRYCMILATGGDIHFALYMWHMVLPAVLWNAAMGALVHGLLQTAEDREDYIW